MSARDSDDGLTAPRRRPQSRDDDDDGSGNSYHSRRRSGAPEIYMHNEMPDPVSRSSEPARHRSDRQEDARRQYRDDYVRDWHRRRDAQHESRRDEEADLRYHGDSLRLLEEEARLKRRLEEERSIRRVEEERMKLVEERKREKLEAELRLKKRLEEEHSKKRKEDEEWNRRIEESKRKIEETRLRQKQKKREFEQMHPQGSSYEAHSSHIFISPMPYEAPSPSTDHSSFRARGSTSRPRQAEPPRIPRYRDSSNKQRKTHLHEPRLFDADGFLIPQERKKTIRGVEEQIKSGDLVPLMKILSVLSDNKSPASEQFQELQEKCESNAAVAELLVDDALGSPWTMSSFDATNAARYHGTPRLNHHYQSCVHQLARTPVTSSEGIRRAFSATADEGVPDVSQVLGLAGLGTNLDIGNADFAGKKRDRVTVRYDDSDSRYLLASIKEVVRMACSATTLLQEADLCCDSFTVLRLPRDTEAPTGASGQPVQDCVQLCRVNFSLLLDLSMALDLALQFTGTDRAEALKPLCLTASKILSVATTLDVHAIYKDNDGNVSGIHHIASLAAQFMAVGIQSYSQAHSGEIHPSCLLDPLRKITLGGSQGGNHIGALKLHFQLQPLACLKGMMAQGVMVVVDDAGASVLQARKRPLQIITTGTDFVDTWDDSRLIFAEDDSPTRRKVVGIRAGGGMIALTGKVTGQQSGTVQAAHWTSRNTLPTSKQPPFSPDTMLMIGASTVSVNTDCTLDEGSLFIEAESRSQLDKLCTSNDVWENNTRTVGLTAGQYVSANFANAYTKRPGVTMKQAYMEAFATDLILKPILESTWGLQLSLCTGVARRVPMYTLVADIMDVFAGSSLHEPNWKRLTRHHDVVGKMRDNKLRDLLTELRNKPTHRETLEVVIKGVLNTMKHTGVDSSTGQLIVAWPHEDDPLTCMKFPCDDTGLWTKMLADTPNVATFAYITPQCLETDTRTCTRAHRSTWRLQPFMLHTAVNVDNKLDRAAPRQRLRDGQEYWVGKDNYHLRARPAFRHGAIPYVYVTQSKLWGSMQRRLAQLDKARGLYLCLQERRRMAVPAKDVIVLTSPPAMQARPSLSSSSNDSIAKSSYTTSRRGDSVPRSRRSRSKRRPRQSQHHDFCQCSVM